MSFKIFSHKLTARKQKKHGTRFCSKLFKVSTTSVNLPEEHVKHVSESENLRGSGLPQLPLLTADPGGGVGLQGLNYKSNPSLSKVNLINVVVQNFKRIL